ncbi:hypothetical protein, partial [Paenibacillus graminis]|uniref:hypothetical protein n=1 Tax=Paenibacillus graminis TaxID=189425 RepID=UPI002DD09D5B|nr:hypothetical protein [Paenibacillus graminis]
GDITIPVGGGAAAITAGAIVDADINSAAQINATKIGTAGITNTEFGYLDGVTGNIQTQLNNRPQQTTADITYYVRTDGNDANNGLANTAAGAFKTINKAVSMIPTVVDHTVSINVAAGTYSETVNVMGRRGAGSITIVGIGTTTFVKSVTAFGVERLSIYNLTATDATQIGFYIQYGGFVTLSACVTTVASSADGFNISFQHGVMTSCVVSNKTGAAISVNSGVLTVDNCTGTSNVIAFYGDNSAIIHTKGSTVPAGSSYVGAATTINPWGDNTRNNRSVASATPSATQSVP